MMKPGYLKDYYAAHRDKAVAYAREYRVTHRKEIAASRKARRIAHPEENRARCAAYYAAHRDEMRAKFSVYQATHRETIAPRVAVNLRKWLAGHPGQGSAYMNARRTLKAGNGGSHTLSEWQEKCAAFGNLCAYCGEAKPLCRDHDLPLSRGGTDNIANVIPACRRCNSKKSTRTALEFFALMPVNDATTGLLRIA